MSEKPVETNCPVAFAADAPAETIAHSLAECLGGAIAGPALGFVYVTDHLAEDLAGMLEVLREGTGITDWIGSVGIGIIAGDTEYLDRPAAAAMLVPLPAGTWRRLPSLGAGPRGDGTLAVPTPHDFVATVGIIHADPHAPRLAEQIDTLSQAFDAFLVGGITSSRGPCWQVAGDVTSGGVSGVLLSAEVALQTGLSQGCSPISGVLTVTECQDNILESLDGSPALAVLRDELEGASARGEPPAGQVHAAILRPGSDRPDYMVRHIMGSDARQGTLIIAEHLSIGDRLMFVRRDPASAERDLAAMVVGLRQRLSRAPRGAVYFSCIARGSAMFGAPGREVGIVREHLGDIPVVGMFCNGEIFNDRVYGYTGVLVAFL